MLRAVEQALKGMGIGENCEVAFFDKSEGYWRTIHPYGAPLFDRFFSKDNFKAAREQFAADLELLQQALSALNRIGESQRRQTQ